MNKYFTFLKKKRFWALAFLLGFLTFVYAVLQLRMSDWLFAKSLSDTGFQPKIERYLAYGRTMRYVEIGSKDKPLILAIHGAPSSSGGWRNMLTDTTLLTHSNLIAVDRPGYGYSGYGDFEKSLQRQAAMIAPILRAKRGLFKTILVAGSSYGGPVAARLAMDYPDLVDGLCLISASVAPGEEKTYFISYPTTHRFLEWLLPKSFQMANREKLTHREELLEMVPDWRKIVAPTTILHGDKDELIYVENAYFAARKLAHAVDVDSIIVQGKGHGFPFDDPQLVVETLLKSIRQTEHFQKIKENSAAAVPLVKLGFSN